MKNNGTSWLTIAITFTVGILLIVWHSRLDVLQWIITAFGLMILIPSVYSIISAISAKNRDKEGTTSFIPAMVTAIGGVALGLWMVIDPTFFVGLIAYVFAAILIIFGILQLINIVYWARPYVLPLWFYIVPALMIIVGVVIICTTVRTMNSIVVLSTGILLVASAINWAIEYSVTHPARRNEEDTPRRIEPEHTERAIEEKAEEKADEKSDEVSNQSAS